MHSCAPGAGDHPRSDPDWGLHQMDATNDVDKSFSTLIRYSTLGDHLLHHLFPTVDHSKLHHLYPAFWQTCKEFGVTYKYLER